MSGAMNRHCIPGLTIFNSPDGELLCGSVRNNLKRCTQGLEGVHVLYYANAPVLSTEGNRTL